MKAKVLFFALAVTGLCLSCNEYYEDMEALGKRVEVLEDSVLSIDNSLRSLELLTQAMLKNGYITRIDDNDDGSCTIYLMGYFDDSGELTEQVVTLAGGRQGTNGRDGKDGKKADELLGVAVGEDGQAYWIFNGQPLLDEDGNVVPVKGPNGKNGKDGNDGKDGEDGKNGKDGKDADPASEDVILPQVRISEDDRTWEISLDGGKTWTDTNVPADGKDGEDGKDGDDGKPGENGADGKADSWVISIYENETEVVFVVHVSPSGNIQTLVVPKNWG